MKPKKRETADFLSEISERRAKLIQMQLVSQSNLFSSRSRELSNSSLI